MGFFNYVSPWMRREAKTQVAGIQNSFNTMYTAILHARRIEAMNLSLQAQQAREALAKAEEEVAARDAQIAILQAHLLSLSSTT